MNLFNNNNAKKTKYGFLAGAFLGLSLICGGYSAKNIWSMHLFDKYVIKHIEIAANVPSVSGNTQTASNLSMQSSLEEAKKNLHVSPMKNPAIIWKTPLTEVGALEDLLKKAIERCRQIGQFQNSFSMGKVDEEAPAWVKDAYVKLDIGAVVSAVKPEERKIIDKIVPSLSELAESEYGQRIGSEYESVNTVVAGGTRLQGKSLKERHRSLLDTLDKAGGWRSIIRFQADDYMESYADVFVGYLMANMGYVSEGLEHFRKAKQIMDKYPDDKNLAIIRDTPELSQETIKGLIESSIKELEALDKDKGKYSTGWWKRLRYYNQSIGGQTNPSIQDMAEEIQGRYSARFFWSGILGLGFLFLAGRYAKRLRNANVYEVNKYD